MNNQTEAIRKACIEAIPEITGRDIRLADMLFAIAWHCKKIYLEQGSNVAYLDFNFGGPHSWNLRTDRIEDQSTECIEFLYKLLAE